MARLGIFSKACSFVSSGRLFANNRLNSVTLQSQIQAASFSESSRGSDKRGKLNIPDKPKRPLSPFFRFISEHRPVLASQHPDCKATDLIKKCAEDWKSVQVTVKEQYQEEYKKEMEDYSKKYLEYASQLTPEQKEALKEKSAERRQSRKKRLLKKKNIDLKKPKRPLQPYMLFLKHQREIRDLKFPECMKILAAEWQQLPDHEKTKYRDIFVKDNANYEVELNEWEKKMIKQGNIELVRKMTIEKLDIGQRKAIEEKLAKMKGGKGGTEKDEKKDAKKVPEVTKGTKKVKGE